MWEAIEEYDVSMRKVEKKEKLGNPGFLCLPLITTKPASPSAPVHFLPKNFYRPTWWLSQHEYVQSNLQSKLKWSLPNYSQ
jgi:hypothetical protein